MSYSPMELAYAFLQTGEYDDALDALNEQVKNEPDDTEARILRASLLIRMGDTNKLNQAITDLENIDNKTAEQLRLLSVAYERQQQLDKAIEFTQKAHSLAPDDERLTERLVTLLRNTKQIDEAIALVRQQSRSWRWLQWEGDLLLEDGNAVLAIARYGLVLAQLDEIDMRDDYRNAMKLRLLSARATAYRMMQQYDLAQEHYEQAQKLMPNDITLQFNIGVIGALNGDFDNGIISARNALDNASNTMRQHMIDAINAEDDIPQTLRDALLD